MNTSVARKLEQDEQVRDLNLGAQRTCVVRLDHSYVDFNGRPKPLKLSWHTGKPTPTSLGRATSITLWPEDGKDTVRLPLERAQAMFGLFTVPMLLEEEYDERRRKKMLADFRTERDRAIMAWGEFPRGQITERGNGGDIIGPCRFPPVIITVEEADGTAWEPIDVRALYELGSYRDTDTRPAFQRNEETIERDDELETLREQVEQMSANQNRLEGQIAGLAQALNGIAPALAALAKQNAEPKAEKPPAATPPKETK